MTAAPNDTQRLRIGTYTLDVDTEVTNHYETAAWYQTVRVPAGEYPIYGTFKQHDSPRAWHEIDRAGTDNVPGIVTASFFPSLFGGVMVGRDTGADDVGKPGLAHGRHWFGYDLARESAKKDTNITLEPGIVLERQPYLKDDDTPGMFYNLVSETAALLCPDCSRHKGKDDGHWWYRTHAGGLVNVSHMEHYPLECRRCHRLNEQGIETEHRMHEWRIQRIADKRKADAESKAWIEHIGRINQKEG